MADAVIVKLAQAAFEPACKPALSKSFVSFRGL